MDVDPPPAQPKRRITPRVLSPQDVVRADPAFGGPAPEPAPEPTATCSFPLPPPPARQVPGPLEGLSREQAIERVRELEAYVTRLERMGAFAREGEKPAKRLRHNEEGDPEAHARAVALAMNDAEKRRRREEEFRRLTERLERLDAAENGYLYERDAAGNVLYTESVTKDGETVREPVYKEGGVDELDRRGSDWWRTQRHFEDMMIAQAQREAAAQQAAEAPPAPAPAVPEMGAAELEAEEAALQEESRVQQAVIVVDDSDDDEPDAGALATGLTGQLAVLLRDTRAAFRQARQESRADPRNRELARALRRRRTDLVSLIATLSGSGPIATQALMQSLRLEGGTACFDADVGPKHLLPHQRMPARYIRDAQLVAAGVLLCHNTGEGKTLAACAAVRCAMERLRRELPAGTPDPVALVVAPASIVGDWQEELDRVGLGDHSVVVSHSLCDYGKLLPTTKGAWRLSGVLRARLGFTEPVAKDTAPDTVADGLPVDAVNADVDAKAAPFARRGVPIVLVVDEVHAFRVSNDKKKGGDGPRVRNDPSKDFPDGLRLDKFPSKTAAVLRFAQHASFVVSVTATPMPAVPADIAVPIAMAMTASSHAEALRLRTEQPPLPPDTAIAVALAKLRDVTGADPKLRHRAVPFLRGIVSFRGVPIESPTRARPGFPVVYWDMVPVTLSAEATATYAATEEQEVRSKTRALKNQTRKAADEKLLAVARHVTEFATRDEPGIVVCESTATVDTVIELVQQQLAEALTRRQAVAKLTGSMGSTARKEVVERFNRGQLALLVITTAGATGINLSGARFVVFAEQFWSRAKTLQFAARAVRMGSHDALDPPERTVTVIELYSAKAPASADAPRLVPVPLEQFEQYYLTNQASMTTDGYIIDRAIKNDRAAAAYMRRICDKTALEHEFGIDPCGGDWELGLNNQEAAVRVQAAELTGKRERPRAGWRAGAW